MNDQKIALVTGANSGMGRATSTALARAGFRVIMLCRSEERGRAALQTAKAAAAAGSPAGAAAPELELAVCDLASISGIRLFAADLRSRIDSLDLLVNNAGVISPKRLETEDGFELQLGVNHLGHFLLTDLLIDLVEEARGRVVVVASGAPAPAGLPAAAAVITASKAALPRSSLRQSMMTRKPARARAAEVALPIPELAPVTKAIFLRFMYLKILII